MKKYSTRKFSILALLFLVISVPLAVYSIVNITSLDNRNKAADLTLDVETCQIRFPFVNPESVEVNKTVQVNVSAQVKGEAITQVSVMDRTGTSVFKKDYTTGVDKISETFTINPKDTGDFGILGTLTSDKGTRPCVVESNRTVNVVSANVAPEFKTVPTSAQPSNVIKVNDSYQYQLQATDTEKDNINFAFSFTPDASWLKSTVVENGTGGKLTIKFSGTPDKPGSYLANIFIHDGYNSHLRAQTWVINVDQDKNDIPKVSIIRPSSDIQVQKGEKVTVSWEGADLNQIVKYELYVATNPGNANTWVTINRNIGPKVGNYIVDTKDLSDGTYQFIVKATDNFNPPGVGQGVSAKVVVDTGGNNSGPDDGVVVQEAQVVNLSPSNESSIKNKSAIISATLVPSKDATIKKESIKIVLDDQDVTAKSRINEGSDNTYTVIYTPETEHSEGVHKAEVSFEDSKGNKVTKSWTFTVIPEDSNTDVFNIGGFEIPKRIAYIVGAGLAILLLALIVPWLLYLAWRGTKENAYEEAYQNTTPIKTDNPPVTFVKSEKETTVIKESEPVSEVVETKVENKPIEPKFTFNKTVVQEQPQLDTVSESTSVPTIEYPKVENPVSPIVEPEVKIEEQPIVPTPEVQPENTLPTTPTVEDVTFDIEESTNRELEELANKLKAKEEMLNEFMPTQSDTAPSSLDASPEQPTSEPAPKA